MHDPESKYLGLIELFRPGSATAVASYKAPIGQSKLATSYPVTDADLATQGNWSCRIINSTVSTVTFDNAVVLNVPQQITQKTATFNLGLLNTMIAEAFTVAQVGFQLNSSADANDQRSVVSWSQDLAASLPGPMKNQTAYWFRIPDYRLETSVGIGSLNIGDLTFAVIRFSDIESDPDTPITAGITRSASGVPAVEVSVTLKSNVASATAIDSDVDLDKLDPELDLSLATISVQASFDGTAVTVTANFQATINLAGLSWDLTEYLSTSVQEPVNGWTSSFNSATVRGYVDDFFVDLMRLGSAASNLSYATDGVTLAVTYRVPEVPPIHPVVPAPQPSPAVGAAQ